MTPLLQIRVGQLFVTRDGQGDLVVSLYAAAHRADDNVVVLRYLEDGFRFEQYVSTMRNPSYWGLLD